MNQNKKSNRQSDIKVLIRLYALFVVHNRSTTFFCILTSLITGTRPYIMVVLSGILIDGLLSGKFYAQFLMYLGAGFLLNFAAQIAEAVFRENFNARVENCLERQNLDMNEQSMNLDFENLENPVIQDKKRKQEQVVNLRGGLYWLLIWPLDKGLTGLVSVITAIVVSGRLFFAGSSAAHPSFAVLSVLLVLLIAGCTWGSFQNNNYWNHRGRLVLDEYAKEKKKSNYLLHHILSSAEILIAGCTWGSFQNNNYWNHRGRLVLDEYAKEKKKSNYLLHHILSSAETGKDLRIFHQQDLIADGAVRENEKEVMRLLKKSRSLAMTQQGINSVLSTATCAGVYLYAAVKAFYGMITIGSVVQYSTGIMKCITGLTNMLWCASGWKRVADYGREYLEYIDCLSTKDSGSEPVQTESRQRILLECENVSFRYPGSNRDVIKNLNLRLLLHPGEHIAVVGRNGSGKTTFIKLLCRLYDVTEGEIRINGKNIKEYSYEAYLDLFGVVFQDYKLFALKLGETIAASEEVDEASAQVALEKAGLKEKLEALQAGMDTYVGKEFDASGVNFSGGERQKLAIARAIYKNAPLVIMDEPTSALDPIAEFEVYEGFSRLVGDKAAVYISHRLASCRFCSKILVFHQGRIEQEGSHEELVKEDGLYRNLWNAAVYISHRLASCRFCSKILVFHQGRIEQEGSHEELVKEDGLYRNLWNAQAQYYQV